MKRYGGLYEQVCDFTNLLKAAHKAQRGKRTKPNVAQFNFHLEREILMLQHELRDKTWAPGPYVSFHIYEPKKRLISAAPYRDRVVHHALCNVIEPIFERAFIHDSYANRVGKGTHRAVDRLTAFCRKNRYVLQCDIKKYFPTIDHEILYGIIAHKIKDPDVLWLVRQIIDSSNPQEPVHDYFPGDNLFSPVTRRKGLPIGNLTSQFFANLYLNGFDHFVKRDLGGQYYIRFCDDFVVLSDDKNALHAVKHQMADYLADLRLKLHPTKCQVFPVTQGTCFLGYRIFPTHRRLKRANIRHCRQRLRRLQHEYAQGRVSIQQVGQSVQSWIAHAAHADTFGLRRQVLGNVAFRRG
jgi:retron-type reverse transcriptase